MFLTIKWPEQYQTKQDLGVHGVGAIVEPC
jgi:hypothetical protein